MADEADIGNEIAQKHLDMVLSAHGKPHAVSNECVECGESISSARQSATGGTDLCVNCASEMELKDRLYR